MDAIDALDDLPVEINKGGEVLAYVLPVECPVGHCGWRSDRGSLLGGEPCVAPAPGHTRPCLITAIGRTDDRGATVRYVEGAWPPNLPSESDAARLRPRPEAMAPALPPVDRQHVAVADGAPSTSVDAAARAFPGSGTLRRRLVDAIAEHGPMTDDRLEQVCQRSHQSVSSGRNALVSDGWLEDSGEEHPTRSGSTGKAWALTAEARRQLAIERGSR